MSVASIEGTLFLRVSRFLERSLLELDEVG